MKINNFITGFVTATLLSSVVIYGGTLVDGIFTFSAGEVISASEINHNFERIRGEVIFEGFNSQTYTFNATNTPQICYVSGSPYYCNLGFVDLDDAVAGNVIKRVDPTVDVENSATFGQDYSYFPAAVSGFYELTLISTSSTSQITVNEEYEYASADINLRLLKIDGNDSSKGVLSPGTNSTFKLDGVDAMGTTYPGLYESINDTDGDGDNIGDNPNYSPPTNIRKLVYLKAGEALVMVYDFRVNDAGTPVNGDGFTFNPGSIYFKMKRIID